MMEQYFKVLPQFVVNSAAVQNLPHVAMRKLCTVLPFVEEAASEIETATII